MTEKNRLAELHLHLYGCLRSDHVLDMLARHPAVAWERYEPGFFRAFGDESPARALVERHRQGDPTVRDAFREVFEFGDADAGSFARFQAKFDLIIAASIVGRAYRENDEVRETAAIEEIAEVAARIADDQASEGIGYAEQRMFFGKAAPDRFVDRTVDTLLRQYSAPLASGITRRLAVSLPREDPWPHWEIVQKHALGAHGEALTGVDFCFFEEGHPPKKQRAFFAAVHAHNEAHPERALSILYHVGESFGDKSLESAVRWVQESAEAGAHRLGHAIALGVEPSAYGVHTRDESVEERLDQIEYDLLHHESLGKSGVIVDRSALAEEAVRLRARPTDERITHAYDESRLREVHARQSVAMAAVRRAGAVIEVCPTSNLRIGGLTNPTHHPAPRFLREGLRVVVASDDPGLFGTRLADEVAWVRERAGLGEEGERELREAAWGARSEVLSGREAAARGA